MQKHKCKLCSKSFCNGRALGGHMKSHLLSSSQSSTRKKLADSVHSSSSSSDGKSLVYALRENPRKSFRVMNPDPELSTLLYDSETETEPESEDPVRKRSRANQVSKKKTKKSKKLKTSHYNSTDSPEPASSVSDGSPEQDLAMCLMMLSRDSRELQIINPMIKPEEETTKPEKRRCPELRRCVIDLNLPPPQENEVATVVSAI